MAVRHHDISDCDCLSSLRLTRRGFTLIELLVVVAIVALLIAILLPSLRAARRNAKRAVCAANQRSLAIAWQNYLDESGGRFLQYRTSDTYRFWNINFGGQQGAGSVVYQVPKPLNRYVGLPTVVGVIESGYGENASRLEKTADVFRCPDDEGGDNVRPSNFHYYGTSYQTNLLLIGPEWLSKPPGDPVGAGSDSVLDRVNDRLPGLTRSMVSTDSSKLVMLGDYGWVNTQTYSSRKRIEWHGARCYHNLTFLDGHVEFTRVRKGVYVAPEYVVIPFRDLAYDAARLQQELSCD